MIQKQVLKIYYFSFKIMFINNDYLMIYKCCIKLNGQREVNLRLYLGLESTWQIILGMKWGYPVKNSLNVYKYIFKGEAFF